MVCCSSHHCSVSLPHLWVVMKSAWKHGFPLIDTACYEAKNSSLVVKVGCPAREPMVWLLLVYVELWTWKFYLTSQLLIEIDMPAFP